MALNATPCDPAADSYISVADADSRMTGFLQGAKWDLLEIDEKERLLKWASRQVGQYRMGQRPPKQQSSQALPFPTAKDTPPSTNPAEVVNATLETVDYKLENKRVTLKQQQAEGVTAASLLGQSKSFSADPSGLPAEARRELDKLFGSYEEIDLGGVQHGRRWDDPRCV